jgi:hypothetical protein
MLILLLVLIVTIYTRQAPNKTNNNVGNLFFGDEPITNEIQEDDSLLNEFEKIKNNVALCGVKSGKLNNALNDLRSQLNKKKTQFNTDLQFCEQKVPEQIKKYIRFNKTLGKTINEEEVKKILSL